LGNQPGRHLNDLVRFPVFRKSCLNFTII
jgi:hypothetical protein